MPISLYQSKSNNRRNLQSNKKEAKGKESDALLLILAQLHLEGR